MRNYIGHLRAMSQASNPESERVLPKRVAVPQVCRSGRVCCGCWPTQRGTVRRYAFIFSTSFSPQWSAGWLVGLPSARTRRWVAEGGGCCGAVGAAGWAGRRGRYRFHPAWRGEEKDHLPPVLPAPLPVPRQVPRVTHALRVTGSKLTAAGSLLLLRNGSLATGARQCVPIFFSFRTYTHTHVRWFAPPLLRHRGINPSGLLVIRYVDKLRR